MTLKRLIKNKEDLISFYKYIIGHRDIDLWNPEDRPRLEPYFKWFSRRESHPMTTKESESFEYYKLCDADYGQERAHIRDSIRNLDDYEIARSLYINVSEPNENDFDTYEEWDNAPNIYEVNEENFPFVVNLVFDSSFDRGGDRSMIVSTFTYLSDFKGNNDT